MTVSQYPYQVSSEQLKKQMEIELDVRQAGAVRYQKQLKANLKQMKGDNTSYAARIIAKYIDPVAHHLDEWLVESDQRTAGVAHLAIPFIKQCDLKVCAMLGLKTILGRLFSEEATLTSTTIMIGKAIEEELRLTKLRAEDRKAYNGVMKAAADKNRGKSRSRTANFLADRNGATWDEWSDKVRAHVGMVVLTAIQSETGMFELKTITAKKSKTNVLIPTDSTKEWVKDHVNFMQFMKPQLEPMVVPPKPWELGELDGGYLTSHVPVNPFVKTRNRRYLEELKYADMPVVVRSVTAIQNVKWQINPDTIKIIDAAMTTNLCIGGLPRKDYLDEPPKPFDIAENKEARRAWATRSRKVHEENQRIMSKKIAVQHTLSVARKYLNEPAIFCPANVDFRARVYFLCQLSIQGPDFIKSLLRFSEGKRIGEDGINWLKYHIANLFGVDKVSQEDRVKWVDDNTEELLLSVTDPFGEGVMWHDADDPYQAYVAILELKSVMEKGADHITHIPIFLDGSCSGIQHLSMAFLDEIGGREVNLLPFPTPQDIYQRVADKSNEKLRLLINDEDSGHMAKWWLEFGVNRKTCKRNCMTFAYSSKQRGFSDQILEDTLRPAELDGLELPEGLTTMGLASFLAKINYESVCETVIKAGEAMEWLSNAARKVAKQNLPIAWHTPLGFPVVQAYRNYKPIRVETNLNGKRVTMSIQEETLKIDSRKSASAIAPNFVHSLDAAHLQLVADRSTQEGIHNLAFIHDAFGTHACDMPRFYGIIRETFVELYEQPVFENFKKELEGQLPEGEELDPLPSKGNLDPLAVLDSQYCFA